MKEAKKWADDFLNKYVLNTKGNNEFLDLVKEIQNDARRTPLHSLQWIKENPMHDLVQKVAEDGMSE